MSNTILDECNETNISYIKNKIENMNKHHQIEVLRILKQYKNVVLNENSNGVFINLIDLDKDIISTLYKYIVYVDNQTININNIEIQKEQLEKEFFTPLIE
jgi:hypothetical protein